MDARCQRVQGVANEPHLSKGTAVKAYRFFAYLIAVEVVVQAAAIAFGVFGESKFIDDGGTVDKALVDAKDTGVFTGAPGYAIHSINGTMVIPLLALILLIIAFFAKVPGGAKAAGIVLLLVVVQVALGITAHAAPWLGPLHGINAFGVFVMAILAGKRASTGVPAEPVVAA
ncbi:MAG: hypothetical protein JWM40_2903 [Frankiales bacterium]|nr:hypothetical protein [Frankiales bacterium]